MIFPSGGLLINSLEPWLFLLLRRAARASLRNSPSLSDIMTSAMCWKTGRFCPISNSLLATGGPRKTPVSARLELLLFYCFGFFLILDLLATFRRFSC